MDIDQVVLRSAVRAEIEALRWNRVRDVAFSRGRPLRAFIANIVDAAGIEGVFHMTTDRESVLKFQGGVCIAERDLARYMSIFVRRGRGVSRELVGSAAFIEGAPARGVPMPYPYEGIRYSNHLMVSDRSIGHGG